MFASNMKRGLGALVGALVCAQAWAAVPNDRWTDRTTITALPYSIAQADIGSASFNSDEPIAPCFPNTLNPGNAVWYSYTTGADTEYLNLDTLGSSYDSVLSVWTGTPNHFELVGGGCNDNGNQDASANTARIAGLRLAPNTEYSILVSRITQTASSSTLKLAINPAPVYRVTRTGDRAGAVCAAGDCSLREAISNANAAPGAVLVPAGTYKIELAGTTEDNNATGDFDLKAPMSLYGVGMNDTVIDGNALDRVIHVDPSITGWTQGRMTAHFADLTIRGGKGSSSGAGIFSNSGGAFLSAERVAVRDNETGGNGGGIQAALRAYLREVLVQNNVATLTGGGINLSSTTTNVNFDIVGSAILGNHANGAGTSGTGGGINSTQLLRISNSTIDGNEAYANGGGINVDGAAGELALYSSTVTHNRSDADANGVGSGGGLRFNGSRTSAVRNTVFAYNVDPTNPGAGIFGPDCSKNNTTTLGITYSLVSDKRGSCSYTGSTNLLDISPGFDGQLGDHGGPTPTLLPLAASPLVDAGDDTGCKDFMAGERAFDQRGAGHPRVVDGGSGVARCDIGAVEYEAPAVEPVAGAPALLAVDDSGISSNDGITNVVSPRFAGSCRGEAAVHLLIDGVREAVGTPCAVGGYLVTVAVPLADGAHAVSAQALVGDVWTEPTASIAVTIDTRAPVVTFSEAPGHGITVSDTQFRVSVDEAVPALCSLDNATPAVCRNPHTLFLLGMGAHRFVATATDLAGNVGSAEYLFERVELSPLETPFLDASTDSGRSNSDGVTKADPIRIIGTCRTGDLVKVYDIDAYMNASGTCTGGAFSIDVAGVPEGLRVVGVSATRAGLETSHSPGAFVLIDRTPPAAPTLVFSGVVSGSRITVSGTAEGNADVTVLAGAQAFCNARAASNGQWSCTGDLNGQTTLTATATDVAGNTSTASTPLQIDLSPLATPFLDPTTDTGRSNSDGITKADPIRITGTCRDGDLVKVYDIDEYLSASGACSASGTFSIVVAGLREGLRVIGVSATRAGLETSRSAGALVLIDRTAPVAPSVVLPAVLDSSQFAVSGSAEANADVAVIAGTHAFCGARAGSDGQWSCSGDLGGESTLSATATDVAGNVSVASAPVQIELTPLDAPFLDPATDSGRSNSDGITAADPIRITGTCRNGDLVKVYDLDEYLSASDACGTSGTFAIIVAGLGEGLRVIGVSATRAGLETSLSTGAFVLIDRTPPAAPTVVLPAVFDSPSFDVSGSAEANADIVVLADTQPFCSTRAGSDGHWSCGGDLGSASTLSATATDVAGNTGTPSAPISVEWDRLFRDGFDG